MFTKQMSGTGNDAIICLMIKSEQQARKVNNFYQASTLLLKLTVTKI
jgi:hypothetical protein